MSPPFGEVRVVDDVAGAFADVVVDAFGHRPGTRFSLVLSGGPTARLCYERLAASAPGAVDWGVVDVYMGDERCVDAEDPDANQRLVREALLRRVGAVGSFHPMACDDIDAYQDLMATLPALDLVHLGVGPDGHTASLFPGAPGLDAAPGRLVIASRDPHERNPHDRMSLTLEVIARARVVVFTVSGASKRDAWAALCAGADLPAARVRAGTVIWLVDRAAEGASAPAPAGTTRPDRGDR